MTDKLYLLIDEKFKDVNEKDIILQKIIPSDMAVRLYQISNELNKKIDSQKFFSNSIIYKSDIYKLFK